MDGRLRVREVWKDAPSMPGYMASSLGRVRRKPQTTKTGKVRYFRPITGTCYKTKPAYHMVKTAEGKHYKVSRVVCEAFHGPPPPDKPMCLHIDEDSHNNKPENLKWGTNKENLNAPGYIAYRKTRTKANGCTNNGWDHPGKYKI